LTEQLRMYVVAHDHEVASMKTACALAALTALLTRP
jgi:hypothetical protein